MTLFQLNNEYVIDVHRVSWPDTEAANEFDCQSTLNNNNSNNNNNNNNNNKLSSNVTNIKSSTQNYAENRKMYERNNDTAADDIDDRCLMQIPFPKIQIDKCMVVTNNNLYMIEIK